MLWESELITLETKRQIIRKADELEGVAGVDCIDCHCELENASNIISWQTEKCWLNILRQCKDCEVHRHS